MKNDGSILFHVYVPVYNVEPYIKQCIESVLSQTYVNFKLVLVDDGSPDLCGLICDEYASRDDRIVVIHQENKGLIGARQAALRWGLSVDGNRKDCFVVHLDSDDYLDVHALEEIASIIEESVADLVVYGANRISNDSSVIDKEVHSKFVGMIEDKEELFKLVLSDSSYNSLCLKAACISLYGGIDYSRYYGVSQGEDLLQSMELYNNCKRALFVKRNFYNYRMNPSSITHSITASSFSNSCLYGYVVNYLTNVAVVGTECLEVFYNECIRSLNCSLKDVLNYVPDEKTKIALLKQMKGDEFNAYLLGCCSIERFWFLKKLKSEKFKEILLVGKVYTFLRRVRCHVHKEGYRIV